MSTRGSSRCMRAAAATRSWGTSTKPRSSQSSPSCCRPRNRRSNRLWFLKSGKNRSQPSHRSVRGSSPSLAAVTQLNCRKSRTALPSSNQITSLRSSRWRISTTNLCSRWSPIWNILRLKKIRALNFKRKNWLLRKRRPSLSNKLLVHSSRAKWTLTLKSLGLSKQAKLMSCKGWLRPVNPTWSTPNSKLQRRKGHSILFCSRWEKRMRLCKNYWRISKRNFRSRKPELIS